MIAAIYNDQAGLERVLKNGVRSHLCHASLRHLQRRRRDRKELSECDSSSLGLLFEHVSNGIFAVMKELHSSQSTWT